MAYIEVLESHNLTVQQWEEDTTDEYMRALFFFHLTGDTDDSPIQLKEQLTGRKGSSITFGMVGNLEGGHVEGNAQGMGNAGTVKFFDDSITVDNVRDLAEIRDLPMTKQRVSFNVLKKARSALTRAAALRMEEKLIFRLTDTSIGRVQGRYQYGTRAWNATHATALGTLDNTADQLTCRLIS